MRDGRGVTDARLRCKREMLRWTFSRTYKSAIEEEEGEEEEQQQQGWFRQ